MQMEDTSGGLVVVGGPQRLDRLEVIQHNRSRHSAALPVVDALLITGRRVEAKQAREGSIAACGLDEFSGLDLVHAHIKHHVYARRNMVCNNALFSRRNMGAMKATPKHAAMRRMYEAAQRLGKLDENELASMARLLNQSAQCVNNWGRRGPSKQARLQFQRDFGVSATWIETGDGEMLIAQPQKQPPTAQEPAQPNRFGNGRQRRLEQLLEAANELDDFGLVALIEKAKDLAKDYPKRKQQAS